jgi:hypothetical protein
MRVIVGDLPNLPEEQVARVDFLNAGALADESNSGREKASQANSVGSLDGDVRRAKQRTPDMIAMSYLRMKHGAATAFGDVDMNLLRTRSGERDIVYEARLRDAITPMRAESL